MSAEGDTDSSDDLTFGEVKTKRLEQNRAAPDGNGHYAICNVNGPSSHGHLNRPEDTKPPTEVFLDLDSMLDMQEHAAEDTSVELGGILLGYRGVHENGTPFVVINDTLRARHYKATRGSFKFTHETWADLHQQRASLPESTEVVGWYHTHPGWGVFLSDLDVFICDHFFSHADDVALVVEPTTGDTGLFVRRNTPANRPPGRLTQYRLFAHRKRFESLNQWADYFSGATSVSNSNAVFPGRNASTPIILNAPTDPSVQRTTLLLGIALIGTQILLGIVLLMAPRTAASTTIQNDDSDTEVREAVVDRLLETLAITGPQGVSESVRDQAIENAELRASNLGLLTRVDALGKQLQQTNSQSQKITLELDAVRKQYNDTQQKLAALQPTKTEREPAERTWWLPDGYSLATGFAIGALIAGLGMYLKFHTLPIAETGTSSSVD
jgi:proteasome lid subunit RPN8/RPN11